MSQNGSRQSLVPNYDSTYLIQASGFPWFATKQDIVEHFNGINILNGENGIHFIIDKTKNSRNEAMIQLATEKDYQKATTQKMKKMGPFSIKSKMIIISFDFCCNFISLVLGLINI